MIPISKLLLSNIYCAMGDFVFFLSFELVGMESSRHPTTNSACTIIKQVNISGLVVKLAKLLPSNCYTNNLTDNKESVPNWR
jgi:hypothetical protein